MAIVSCRVEAWSGLDVLLALLPAKVQARVAARRLMRGGWRSLNPEVDQLYIATKAHGFRIVDRSGRVKEVTLDELPHAPAF